MSRWRDAWHCWQTKGRVYNPPGSLVDFVNRFDYWHAMAQPANLHKERSPWN